MSRVLVTGAGGFIGRHLVRALLADGVEVLGIGHGEAPADIPATARRWRWHGGDIAAQGLSRLVQGGPVDTVYHLAGGASVATSMQHPLADFERTVASTARLLDWMQADVPDAALVSVSSAAVYGSGHLGLIAETAAVRPLSPYGTHKVMVEHLVSGRSRNFGLSSVTVRLFSIYGPGLAKQLLWDLCNRCVAGADVHLGGNGSEARDWLHVSDAVALLRCAAKSVSPESPVVNGGTGIATTVAEVAALVCTAWGNGRTPAFSGVVRPGDPPSLIADTTRASATGFQARTPVADGIKAYVEWFKQHRRDAATTPA